MTIVYDTTKPTTNATLSAACVPVPGLNTTIYLFGIASTGLYNQTLTASSGSITVELHSTYGYLYYNVSNTIVGVPLSVTLASTTYVAVPTAPASLPSGSAKYWVLVNNDNGMYYIYSGGILAAYGYVANCTIPTIPSGVMMGFRVYMPGVGTYTLSG
ncbi:hypothetical protein TTSV1_gp30 [Thermoproteus tenax spherical virus 1]|uniref:Uncharacterized protein n=1 Tax=Thermoproteus tenax spherical virus 1 TaxID=292639 RepID=Q647D2_9VIRU|nr:hypothetical protein TTSV1_gp30 [Thermoproteus tenax spherical virus 1]AAU25980.1 hypothetical protein [Thermoproteus tenax spherical virus 1]